MYITCEVKIVAVSELVYNSVYVHLMSKKKIGQKNLFRLLSFIIVWIFIVDSVRLDSILIVRWKSGGAFHSITQANVVKMKDLHAPTGGIMNFNQNIVTLGGHSQITHVS